MQHILGNQTNPAATAHENSRNTATAMGMELLTATEAVPSANFTNETGHAFSSNFSSAPGEGGINFDIGAEHITRGYHVDTEAEHITFPRLYPLTSIAHKIMRHKYGAQVIQVHGVLSCMAILLSQTYVCLNDKDSGVGQYTPSHTRYIQTDNTGACTPLRWMWKFSFCVAWLAGVAGWPSLAHIVKNGTHFGDLSAIEEQPILIQREHESSLRRVHNVLLALSAFFVAVGSFTACFGNLMQSGSYVIDRIGTFVAATYLVSGGPMGMALWLSVKVAARVVSNNVLKFDTCIRHSHPSSREEWGIVSTQAAKLINVTLPTLSNNWGKPVVCFFIGMWAFASTALIASVEDLHIWEAFFVVICALIPLWLAKDIAQTSTNCNNILVTLHNKRTSCTTDADHLQIFKIELLIRQCNRDQGLGFVVGGAQSDSGVVLNVRMLKTVLLAIAWTSVTVFPLLLTLQKDAAGTQQTHTCDITTTQRDTIRSIMESRSPTCRYNVTLSSILET
eukprot:COSAG01_NODE_8638_length_2712_cov_1.239571_3_plen_506_part_00